MLLSCSIVDSILIEKIYINLKLNYKRNDTTRTDNILLIETK